MDMLYAEYDARKKQTWLALLLWACVGFTAAQEFYLRRYISAYFILLFWWGGIIESVTIASGLGIGMMILAAVWAIVMGFMIPSRVRELNDELRKEIEDAHEWDNRHFGSESLERRSPAVNVKAPYIAPHRGSAVATSAPLNREVRARSVAEEERRRRIAAEDDAANERARRRAAEDEADTSNAILTAALVGALDTPSPSVPDPSPIDAGGGSFGGGGADASWSPDPSPSTDSGSSSSSYDSGSSSSCDSGSSSYDSGSSSSFDSGGGSDSSS